MEMPEFNKQIAVIEIDLKNRTIRAADDEGMPMNWPLSSSGGTIIKWTKISAGGLIIQALTRMLNNLRHDGGNSV